jgi:hypothetical protein
MMATWIDAMHPRVCSVLCLLAAACAAPAEEVAPPVTRSVAVEPPGALPVSYSEKSSEGAVAWNGKSYVALSVEHAGELRARDIYAVRLGPDGKRLDPAAIPVVELPGEQAWSSLACGRGQCLAAWADSSGGHAARIDETGRVLDPNGFRLPGTSGKGSLTVASDGDGYLVAWAGRIGGSFGNPEVVEVVRISREGMLLDDPPITILRGTTMTGGTLVAVGHDGQSFVVVVHFVPDSQPNYLLMTRVSQDGKVLDTPLKPLVLTTPRRHTLSPLVHDGTSFLLAFIRTENDAGVDVRREVLGVRFSSDGLVIGSAPQVLASVASGRGLTDWAAPALAFDGRHYLLLWKHHDIGPSPTIGDTDIDGLLLDRQGKALGGAFEVVGDTGHGGGFGVAAAHAGRALAVYPHSLGRGRATLDGRLLISRIIGEPCAGPAECVSGHCVDGICCDSACGGAAAGCQACSRARGASADGTCTTFADGRSCPNGGSCAAGLCRLPDAAPDAPPDVAPRALDGPGVPEARPDAAGSAGDTAVASAPDAAASETGAPPTPQDGSVTDTGSGGPGAPGTGGGGPGGAAAGGRTPGGPAGGSGCSCALAVGSLGPGPMGLPALALLAVIGRRARRGLRSRRR